MAIMERENLTPDADGLEKLNLNEEVASEKEEQPTNKGPETDSGTTTTSVPPTVATAPPPKQRQSSSPEQKQPSARQPSPRQTNNNRYSGPNHMYAYQTMAAQSHGQPMAPRQLPPYVCTSSRGKNGAPSSSPSQNNRSGGGGGSTGWGGMPLNPSSGGGSNGASGGGKGSALPEQQQLQPREIGVAAGDGNSSVEESGTPSSTSADNDVDGGSHQRRSTSVLARPPCAFFLKTGSCAYGDRCKFDHPYDQAPKVLYNSMGLPMRPDEPPCSFFMKNYHCAFGHTCKYHHPEMGSPNSPPAQGVAVGVSSGGGGGGANGVGNGPMSQGGIPPPHPQQQQMMYTTPTPEMAAAAAAQFYSAMQYSPQMARMPVTMSPQMMQQMTYYGQPTGMAMGGPPGAAMMGAPPGAVIGSPVGGGGVGMSAMYAYPAPQGMVAGGQMQRQSMPRGPRSNNNNNNYNSGGNGGGGNYSNSYPQQQGQGQAYASRGQQQQFPNGRNAQAPQHQQQYHYQQQQQVYKPKPLMVFSSPRKNENNLAMREETQAAA